jgi:hypothetical protein
MTRAWLRTAVLFQQLCFLLSFLLCGYLVFSAVSERTDFNAERLYWEYAGRMSGAGWTPGFSEWVQFRDGPLPGLSTEATRRDAQAPYTEFTAEYPPGALLYFTGLRQIFDDYGTFALAHNTLMAGAFFLSLWIAFASLRISTTSLSRHLALACGCLAAAACPVMIYLIGNFIVSRFDALTALFAAAAALLAQRRHPATAGILLGFGAAVKLWPLFLLPFLFGARRAYVLAGLCAGAGFLACHVALLAFGTAPSDLLGYLDYAFDRPIHSESFLATLIYLTGGAAELEFSFGSWGLSDSAGNTLPGQMQTGYLVLFFAIVLLRFLTAPRVFETPAAGARQRYMMQLGAIALLMCMAKVFSGEYMIWIAPLAVAAAGLGCGAPVVLTLIAMAGVKLGYILTGEARFVSSMETAVFALKWAALFGIFLLACRAGLPRAALWAQDAGEKRPDHD